MNHKLQPTHKYSNTQIQQCCFHLFPQMCSNTCVSNQMFNNKPKQNSKPIASTHNLQTIINLIKTKLGNTKPNTCVQTKKVTKTISLQIPNQCPKQKLSKQQFRTFPQHTCSTKLFNYMFRHNFTNIWFPNKCLTGNMLWGIVFEYVVK